MSSTVEKIKKHVKTYAPIVKSGLDFADKASDLKGKFENLLKLSRGSDTERETLVREILGIDSYFTDPIAAATKVRGDLEKMSGTDITWPEDAEGGALFATGVKVSADKGKGSKEAKAAWAAYARHLKSFGDSLTDAVNGLRDLQAQVPTRKKAARSLVDVSSKIEAMLKMLLKLPVPSHVQAALFAASEDAALLRAQAQVISNLLDGIGKSLDAGIKDGDAIIAQNGRWMAWASKAADKDVQDLKGNARAKTPR
jgi:hypothetical protein